MYAEKYVMLELTTSRYSGITLSELEGLGNVRHDLHHCGHMHVTISGSAGGV
jgi:hypothetical protein